jgi:hypothetical protein
MRAGRIARERTLWIAATAVLATALSWWSVIALGLWIQIVGSQSATVVIVKTLVRAGWMLAREHGPTLAVVPILACGLAAVGHGLWRAASTREGVRHA